MMSNFCINCLIVLIGLLFTGYITSTRISLHEPELESGPGEISITLNGRTSKTRRFPFLKSLVSKLVSPKRRDLGNEPLNGFQSIDINIEKFQENGEEGLESIEAVSSDVISEEERNQAEKTRPRGSFLINILSRVLRSVNFTMVTEEMRSGVSSRASCFACNAVAALYLSPLYSKEVMVAAARSVCIRFRLQTPRVCRGLVDSFQDDLDYIRQNTKLNRHEMCGVLFGMDCSRQITPYLNWTIPVPPRRRNSHPPSRSRSLDSSESSNFHSNPVPSSRSSNYSSYETSNHFPNHLTAIQITDIHIDPYYVPGMNADCGEPLCCRPSDGYASSSDKAAGVWGDYRNCDTPVGTLRHALKHISETHKADYVMWTGDIAPHDIWNVTREEILSQVRLVSNLIKQYIKIPVLPVIGNHEGVPVNSFPPPDVKGDLDISWLYKAIAKDWSYWLPKDAIKTLKYGGYYMVRLRPGFRVVCINTNYCTRLNPWSLFDPIDPGNQLRWLTKELHKAENVGDRVHIIGHIPPDNRECTQAWLFNYLRIIERFQEIVLAQYYGHTHRDEFRILYSPYGDSKPISIEFIGPSITPFTENNPAYRVYHMDEAGFLKDHETYFFNLTEANQSPGGPRWQKEYNALDTFNIKHFGPKAWHELVERFIDDDNLFQYYYRLYFRFSEVKRFTNCYGECKKQILSDLMVAHPLKTRPRSLFSTRKH